MQNLMFTPHQNQNIFLENALFDLLKAISDLKICEHKLSMLDIEHIEVGAKVLNALLARKTQPSHILEARI